MSPRTSPVLLLCGLLCAAGAGFYEQGIQAESSSTVKTAWEHVGPGLAGVMARVAADPIGRGTIYIATMAGGVHQCRVGTSSRMQSRTACGGKKSETLLSGKVSVQAICVPT